MAKISLKKYQDNVRENKEYFKAFEKQLDELTRTLSTLSRQCAEGRVLSPNMTYGTFKLQSWWMEIKQDKPSTVNDAVLVMFAEYHKKHQKNVSSEIYHRMLRKMFNQETVTMLGGFEFGKINGEKVFLGPVDVKKTSMNLSNPNINTIFKEVFLYGIDQIIESHYKKEVELQDAFFYIKDNLDIFPKTVSENIKKIERKRTESDKRLPTIQNHLQYRAYLLSMPEKITISYIETELERLSMDKTGNVLVNKIMLTNALCEKYGVELFLNKKSFIKLLNKSIFVDLTYKNKEALSMNEDQKKLLFSKNIRTLMVAVKMADIGFDLNSSKEKEFVLCH